MAVLFFDLCIAASVPSWGLRAAAVFLELRILRRSLSFPRGYPRSGTVSNPA
jgi:hypothetical protein